MKMQGLMFITAVLIGAAGCGAKRGVACPEGTNAYVAPESGALTCSSSDECVDAAGADLCLNAGTVQRWFPSGDCRCAQCFSAAVGTVFGTACAPGALCTEQNICEAPPVVEEPPVVNEPPVDEEPPVVDDPPVDNTVRVRVSVVAPLGFRVDDVRHDLDGSFLEYPVEHGLTKWSADFSLAPGEYEFNARFVREEGPEVRYLAQYTDGFHQSCVGFIPELRGDVEFVLVGDGEMQALPYTLAQDPESGPCTANTFFAVP